MIRILPVKVVDREAQLRLVLTHDEDITEDEEETVERFGHVVVGAPNTA